MKVVVLGADGFLGGPTALHFSALGHEVWGVDNFSKRNLENEVGVEPLFPVPTAHERFRSWNRLGRGSPVAFMAGDITNYRFLRALFEEVRPDCIVHYAEQPSAPYSMMGRKQGVWTQLNNIEGTLNVLYAMRAECPDAHLVKLGTMGEYGTPNIDIEEGWIEIEHNGRKDRMLYPKKPGSMYHASKVNDSTNIEATCRWWGVRCTDLNQGVVYGIETGYPIPTSFHYDAVFGTVLNRFVVQAACGEPLTVYGKGGQTRGFLDIRDTLQCVHLAAVNPPAAGEFRVFNQFTEQFSVLQLAEMVAAATGAEIAHIPNPRIEAEEHYYNARNTALPALGLKPHLLTTETIRRLHDIAKNHAGNVRKDALLPSVRWAA